VFDISGMGLCIGRVFNVVKAPISVVKVEVKKGLDFKDNFIKFMRLTFKNVFKKSHSTYQIHIIGLSF
jgi:hypothetical protein